MEGLVFNYTDKRRLSAGVKLEYLYQPDRDRTDDVSIDPTGQGEVKTEAYAFESTGENLGITLNPQRTYLFDPQTERRL